MGYPSLETVGLVEFVLEEDCDGEAGGEYVRIILVQTLLVEVMLGLHLAMKSPMRRAEMVMRGFLPILLISAVPGQMVTGW